MADMLTIPTLVQADLVSHLRISKPLTVGPVSLPPQETQRRLPGKGPAGLRGKVGGTGLEVRCPGAGGRRFHGNRMTKGDPPYLAR